MIDMAIFGGDGTMGGAAGLSAPPGIYPGKFVGAEPCVFAPAFGKTTSDPGIQWCFTTTAVVNGVPVGTTISHKTGIKPTLKNACGKMFTSLAGSPISERAPLPNPNDFVGKPYSLIVQASEKGPRLEMVMPIPA
jgi:hypothetical protein